jgi:chromosome segregation ATPase
MKRKSQLKEEVDELKTRESKSSEEIQELKEIKLSNEKEIQRLRNELQQQTTFLEQEKQKNASEKGSSTQLISSLGHRVADKMETIDSLKRENDVYRTLVQSKNNEIDLLKKDNQRYENIEKENLELKRKLEEHQRFSHPLINNNDSTNNDNNNAATNNTTELDNQIPRSDTPNRSVDNIRVKIEAESENDSSPSCQIGNKKRKVSSNDS